MDLKKERHLLWIAREGVAAPVPQPWKTCEEKGEVFYFNFDTEESSWDHPSDAHYRALLEEHRAKSTEAERLPLKCFHLSGRGERRGHGMKRQTTYICHIYICYMYKG